MDCKNLISIANQFDLDGTVVNIAEHGNGNVNDTFLVTLDSKKNFILQRINTQVFSKPKLIMQNMRLATNHLSENIKNNAEIKNNLWKFPFVIQTKNNQDFWIEQDGSFWRAISFIDNSFSVDQIKDISHATEIGYALGLFHKLLSDLAIENLHDTLKGFHITPNYIMHFEKILAKTTVTKSKEVTYCLKFVEDRKNIVYLLENAKKNKILNLYPIHGDPKINNFLINKETKKIISIIDLDTVKPGLIHYDIGDCLRSSCNLQGEETLNWKNIIFETDFCQAILKGYNVLAKKFLNKLDYNYIYDAIRIMTFELGLRFFTDYLEKNVYFKVKNKKQNLYRALVQFKLTQSIELQSKTIETIINDIKG